MHGTDKGHYPGARFAVAMPARGRESAAGRRILAPMVESTNAQRPGRRPGAARAAASPSGLRRRELASLNAIAEVLNRSTDLPEALTRTLTLVAEVLGLHSGWVWLLGEAGEFFLGASYQLPPYLRQPNTMTGWRCLCLRTFEAGDLRGAANVNVLECSRLQDVVDGGTGIAAGIDAQSSTGIQTSADKIDAGTNLIVTQLPKLH